MNDSAEHLDVISENLKNKYAVQTGGISEDVFNNGIPFYGEPDQSARSRSMFREKTNINKKC